MSIDWYKNTYDNLMLTRKSRGLNKKKLDGYYEKHHIIPKCLGGQDCQDNYVLLTFREHVLAHKLLIIIYPDNKKLLKSVTRMLTCTVTSENKKIKREIKSSREAEYIRSLYSKSLVGDGNPNFGKTGEKASHYGYKHSDETKAKISQANKGRLCGEKNPMFGIKFCGEKNPMFGKYGGNHPASKKVVDPEGHIFNSVNECSSYYSIDRHTLMKWIKNKPEKGFKYLNKTN